MHFLVIFFSLSELTEIWMHSNQSKRVHIQKKIAQGGFRNYWKIFNHSKSKKDHVTANKKKIYLKILIADQNRGSLEGPGKTCFRSRAWTWSDRRIGDSFVKLVVKRPIFLWWSPFRSKNASNLLFYGGVWNILAFSAIEAHLRITRFGAIPR